MLKHGQLIIPHATADSAACIWCVLAKWWKLNAPRLLISSWYRTLTATFLAVIAGQFTVAFTNCRRFVLYRRFWNQILTCVSVNFNMAASPARSGPERYFCWLNRRSSSKTCACEKAARDRFLRNFELCLLFSFSCSCLSQRCVEPAKDMSVLYFFLFIFHFIVCQKCMFCKALRLNHRCSLVMSSTHGSISKECMKKWIYSKPILWSQYKR